MRLSFLSIVKSQYIAQLRAQLHTRIRILESLTSKLVSSRKYTPYYIFLVKQNLSVEYSNYRSLFKIYIIVLYNEFKSSLLHFLMI